MHLIGGRRVHVRSCKDVPTGSDAGVRPQGWAQAEWDSVAAALGVAPSMLELVQDGVPDGYAQGVATYSKDDCLVDCVGQLVAPAAPPQRRKKEVARAHRLRQQLSEPPPGAGLPRDGFLDLEESWEAIVRAHGADPSQFTIICYGEEYGYDIVGRGDTVLRVFNEGGDHFVPLWPRSESNKGRTR